MKTCCDKQCLGGCKSPNGTQDCYACQKYRFKGRCVDKCPSNTYAVSSVIVAGASLASATFRFYVISYIWQWNIALLIYGNIRSSFS